LSVRSSYKVLLVALTIHLQSSCVLVRHFLLVAPVVEVVVNSYFSAGDHFSKWFQSSSFPLDLALSGSGFWVTGSFAPISLVHSGELFAPRDVAVRGISLIENPRGRPRGQLAQLFGVLLMVSGQPLVLVVELLWLPEVPPAVRGLPLGPGYLNVVAS
jgi:hypothetical protein